MMKAYKRTAATLNHLISWMALTYPENTVVQNMEIWRRSIINDPAYRNTLYASCKVVSERKNKEYRKANPTELNLFQHNSLDSDEQEHFWKTL